MSTADTMSASGNTLSNSSETTKLKRKKKKMSNAADTMSAPENPVSDSETANKEVDCDKRRHKKMKKMSNAADTMSAPGKPVSDSETANKEVDCDTRHKKMKQMSNAADTMSAPGKPVSNSEKSKVKVECDTSASDRAQQSVEPPTPNRMSGVNDTHAPDPIVFDRLRNFVLFKAYDIIGNGGYRRFVLKNKNNGERWATTLYNDTQYVTRYVRTTLNLVSRLQYSASCVKLHKLCQRVMNDLNPPTISTHGWCICALTGMRTENTTQLGRSNKGETCHVHRKFYKFFCMLWFVARIELCVKYFTIQWLHKHNGTVEHNIQVLCEMLNADTGYMDSLCQKFSHALHHVSNSVVAHIHHMGRTNLIDTSAEPTVYTDNVQKPNTGNVAQGGSSHNVQKPNTGNVAQGGSSHNVQKPNTGNVAQGGSSHNVQKPNTGNVAQGGSSQQV